MMGLKAPWIMEFPKEKYIKTYTPQSWGKDKLINFQYLSHIHNNIYDACAGWQTISKIQAECTAAMKVKFLSRSTTCLPSASRQMTLLQVWGYHPLNASAVAAQMIPTRQPFDGLLS